MPAGGAVTQRLTCTCRRLALGQSRLSDAAEQARPWANLKRPMQAWVPRVGRGADRPTDAHNERWSRTSSPIKMRMCGNKYMGAAPPLAPTERLRARARLCFRLRRPRAETRVHTLTAVGDADRRPLWAEEALDRDGGVTLGRNPRRQSLRRCRCRHQPTYQRPDPRAARIGPNRRAGAKSPRHPAREAGAHRRGGIAIANSHVYDEPHRAHKQSSQQCEHSEAGGSRPVDRSVPTQRREPVADSGVSAAAARGGHAATESRTTPPRAKSPMGQRFGGRWSRTTCSGHETILFFPADLPWPQPRSGRCGASYSPCKRGKT